MPEWLINLTRWSPLPDFATSMEASLARGALEAAGISAIVAGEGLGTFSRNRGGITVTELQVRHSDREKAIAEPQRLEMTQQLRLD